MNAAELTIWDRRNAYWRAKETADRLRAELRQAEQAQDLAKLKRLSPHQRAVLSAVLENGTREYVYHFETIEEWTGLNRTQVCRACRALRRLGFMMFERGCFTEDGEVAGSGYGATAAGETWWREKEGAQ